MLCPICGGPCKDYAEYSRCLSSSCRALRTIYEYDAAQYADGYANNYIRYAQTPTNLPLNLCRLGLVSRWLRPYQEILDFGCCVGEFIRFAEKYFPCVGFEPNKIAARLARERVNSIIHTDFLKLVTQTGTVGALTMFDVLEHIQNPIPLLLVLKERICVGGVIVITTPNLDSVEHRAVEEWKHYKPKEHLYLHTPESLDVLLTIAGFEIAHVGFEESDIRPGNPNDDIVTVIARRKA